MQFRNSSSNSFPPKVLTDNRIVPSPNKSITRKKKNAPNLSQKFLFFPLSLQSLVSISSPISILGRFNSSFFLHLLSISVVGADEDCLLLLHKTVLIIQEASTFVSQFNPLVIYFFNPLYYAQLFPPYFRSIFRFPIFQPARFFFSRV